MMQGWDERTRAWVRDSVARQVQLGEGENVVAKMAGGYYWQAADGSAGQWRHGTIYVTTRRLVAYRREPAQMLWQAALDDISGMELRTEPSAGGEERTRLLLHTGGGTALLTAADPARLQELVRRSREGAGAIGGGAPGTGASGSPGNAVEDSGEDEPPTLLFKGSLWYQEIRAAGPAWRSGTGRYDSAKGFTWQGPGDRRPAIRLQAEEIAAVGLEQGDTPVGNSSILVLETAGGPFRLASDRVGQWALLLRGVSGTDRREPGVPEGDDDAES
jgi:hypothetical protein